MTLPVEANITSAESVVPITAAMGSAGQALATTASSSVRLARGNIGGPVEYKVGAAGWIQLDRNEAITLAIDLSKTAVLVRKATTTTAAINLHLVVNSLVSTGPVPGAPVSAAGGVIATISGTPGVGNVLTAVASPGWSFPSGQWYRGLAIAPFTQTAIAGATALTYTQVTADQGYVPAFTPTNPVYTALGTKVPVPAPVVTTAPVLAAAFVGSPVTWSAGVATGAASGTYSLRTASGAEVATASGQYTPTTQGVQLTVVYTPVGIDGQTASAMSNTVTVGATIPGKWLVGSTRNRYPRYLQVRNAGSYTPRGQLCRFRTVIGSGSPKKLKWSFTNAIFDAVEQLNPNGMTIVEAMFQMTTGSKTVPVTVNGNRSFFIPAGAMDFQTDEILASSFGLTAFPRGAECWMKFRVQVNEGEFMACARPQSDQGYYSVRRWETTNVTIGNIDVFGDYVNSATGFAPPGDAGTAGVAPVVLAFFDDANTRVIGCLGDSIIEGDQNGGWAPMAMESFPSGAQAFMDISASGKSPSTFNQANPYHRVYFKYFNVMLGEVGTNDPFVPGNYFPQIWAAARAAGVKKIYHTRLLPKCSNQANTLSGITFAGTTATVTPTSGAMPLVTGPVSIFNANPGDYNGSFWTVTRVGGGTFDATLNTTPATNLTNPSTAGWGNVFTNESEETYYWSGTSYEDFNAYMTASLASGIIDGILQLNAVRGVDPKKWKALANVMTGDGTHPTLYGKQVLVAETAPIMDAWTVV